MCLFCQEEDVHIVKCMRAQDFAILLHSYNLGIVLSNYLLNIEWILFSFIQIPSLFWVSLQIKCCIYSIQYREYSIQCNLSYLTWNIFLPAIFDHT